MDHIDFQERRIPSADGVHKLYCRVFYPAKKPVGLFHVVHGMTEHIRRYEAFMAEMAAQGYVCFGFDNLGHGYTANDKSELGYLVNWSCLVKDVRSVSVQMKKEFGEQLPCYLLGHSMGSFIARCAATPKIWDKVIFMGTGGPNPAAKAGLAVIRAKIARHGDHAVSPEIEKLVFGAYRTHFKDENDVIAWLSNKIEVRDDYRRDPFCTFPFTLNGYYTLIKLQSMANSRRWFKSISGDLPILLVSGSDDPVGSYGKGVKAVYQKLLANGKNAQMKLYDGCRHEILNDNCREEVIEDILAFLNA